jgi:hypothetical protein
MQVLWLVVYWWGVLPVLYLAGVALVGSVSLDKIGTLTLALLASLLGATWATRIARRNVGSTAFVKGTTTVRVIAIAWLLIGAVIIVGTFTSVVLGLDFGKGGEALGIVSTVGSVSLLAVLGPGYAEYRSVAKPDNGAQAVPSAPTGA